MAKPGVGNRGGSKAGRRTRERIVEAAIETLKTDGFAGASARAIAAKGGFNQALVFYHFGSVNELLLAALDATSEMRMARYREAVDQVRSLGDLFLVATAIYAEDLDSGHIKVLAELMAASTTFPELRNEIVARVEPWVQFTEDVVGAHLEGSPFAALLAPRDVAYAIVALYLGMEMLANLDDNRERADSLFATGQRFATLVGGQVTSSSGPPGGDNRWPRSSRGRPNMGDVIDNGSKNRFEETREGHTAELTYSVDGDRLTLIHTEVPDALGGHGVGGELVAAALERAARDRLTIVPVCPYARNWLRKHTDAAGSVEIDWSSEPLS